MKKFNMGVLNDIYKNVRLYNSDSSGSEDVKDKTEAATCVVAKAEEEAEASEKK